MDELKGVLKVVELKANVDDKKFVKDNALFKNELIGDRPRVALVL